MLKYLTCGTALLVLITLPAVADNCPALPHQITNGTTADAVQVMDNFNNVENCANSNLAHNGANSDITSLSGLTAPVPSATKLAVPHTIGSSGDVSWTSPGYDGSANVSSPATLTTGAATRNLGFTPLNPANNLNDVQNALTSQSNLGIAIAPQAWFMTTWDGTTFTCTSSEPLFSCNRSSQGVYSIALVSKNLRLGWATVQGTDASGVPDAVGAPSPSLSQTGTFVITFKTLAKSPTDPARSLILLY